MLEEQRTYLGPTLTSIKDARGNITYFNSDGIQRITKQTYPDGTYETWTYDNNSNVTSHRSRAGIVTTQVFDGADRLTSKKVGTEPTQTFTSDNVGRLLTASTPIVAGDPSSGTFSRAYDSAGRLISETNPQGEVIGYELDRNGNVTKVTYPSGYYVQYAYDALNRVTSIKLNGSATDAVAFTYDTLSRRTSKTYANGNTIAYGFDIADRLTSRSLTHAGGTATWGYGHNDVNQITSQTISDAAFEWTPAATSSVSYGTPNNLNQYPTVGGATQSHTTDGQLLSDAVWTYQYDGEGMLIAANKTGVAASFKYDPFSRLIERTVNTNKTRYVYAGSRLLEEYDSVTNALLKRYVYAGTDEAVIEIDGAGNVTYLHQDHQNSLIARANGAGTMTAKYKYSPWGEASLPGTGFGYTGQRWDADLGLYNYKARYYDPAKGRFLQPDPVGYKQDMNLYTYCVNDPVNLSDPTGEEHEWFYRTRQDRSGIPWYVDFRPRLNPYTGQTTAGLPELQLKKIFSSAAGNVAGGAAKMEFEVSKRISAKLISFSQEGISNIIRKFDKDGKINIPLKKAVSDLAEAGQSHYPPIRVTEKEGQLITIDNRRLFIHQQAQVPIKVSPITNAQYDGAHQADFPQGTKTIKVRGGW